MEDKDVTGVVLELGESASSLQRPLCPPTTLPITHMLTIELVSSPIPELLLSNRRVLLPERHVRFGEEQGCREGLLLILVGSSRAGRASCPKG